MLTSAEQLEKSNSSLRQECYRLEAEKRYLVKMLMDRAQTSGQTPHNDSFTGTIPQSDQQTFLDNFDFNLQFSM